MRGHHAGIWEAVPEQIVFGTFWRGSVSGAEADVVVLELQETMDVPTAARFLEASRNLPPEVKMGNLCNIPSWEFPGGFTGISGNKQELPEIKWKFDKCKRCRLTI